MSQRFQHCRFRNIESGVAIDKRGFIKAGRAEIGVTDVDFKFVFAAVVLCADWNDCQGAIGFDVNYDAGPRIIDLAKRKIVSKLNLS